jgi:hypothetical protein
MSESIPKFLCFKVNKEKKSPVGPQKKPETKINERDKMQISLLQQGVKPLINEVDKVIYSDENKTITEDDDYLPICKEETSSLYQKNDMEIVKEGIFLDEDRMVIELEENNHNENCISFEKDKFEIKKNDNSKSNENISIKTISDIKKVDGNRHESKNQTNNSREIDGKI